MIAGHIYDMIYVESIQTIFFYDARSKSVYRFVANQAIPQTYGQNSLQEDEF